MCKNKKKNLCPELIETTFTFIIVYSPCTLHLRESYTTITGYGMRQRYLPPPPPTPLNRLLLTEFYCRWTDEDLGVLNVLKGPINLWAAQYQSHLRPLLPDGIYEKPLKRNINSRQCIVTLSQSGLLLRWWFSSWNGGGSAWHFCKYSFILLLGPNWSTFTLTVHKSQWEQSSLHLRDQVQTQYFLGFICGVTPFNLLSVG